MAAGNPVAAGKPARIILNLDSYILSDSLLEIPGSLIRFWRRFSVGKPY